MDQPRQVIIYVPQPRDVQKALEVLDMAFGCIEWSDHQGLKDMRSFLGPEMFTKLARGVKIAKDCGYA